jgi:DNA-binding response OmpR family regulator
VLDDDRAIVEILTSLMTEIGHTPVAAQDLAEVPKTERPDLVLTDLISLTPYRLDGARDWIAQLRERFGVPIVVVTAHAQAAEDARALGADDVLAKPFEVDALVEVVGGLIGS